MSRENFGKPKPDAIATIYGWADVKTGELLVSRRGLPNPVQNYRRNCPFPQSVTSEEISKIEDLVPVVKKPTRSRKPKVAVAAE